MAINGSYMVRETTANLTRNITLTVASILTVFVSLALVGTAVMVRQGVQNMTKEWSGGIEFRVYVDPDATEEEVEAIRSNLDENPGVERIEYVDRDATYRDFRDLFEDEEVMLEVTRPEDLPTSFKVEPVDKAPDTVQELVRYYRSQPHVYEVNAAVELIRELKNLTSFLNQALSVFAVTLLVASTLLILNTIRTAMFARRREIEVMKLVGATNWFIRVPFLLEGLVQGIIGGVFAVAAVFTFRRWLEDRLNQSKGVNLLQSFTIEQSDVVLASGVVVVVAILLSGVSSVLATRRFLDV